MYLEILNNVSVISIASIFVIIMYLSLKDAIVKTKILGHYVWQSYDRTKYKLKNKLFGARDDR